MARFAVVGATSWGVTIANLLASRGAAVDLVVRTDDEAYRLDRDRRLDRLPELVFARGVSVVPPFAAIRPDPTIVAVPAQAARLTLSSLGVSRESPVLSAAKGIEHGSLLRMSEVLMDCGWPGDRVSVISGPNLAHEVARGLPAAAVVASRSDDARMWQEALSGGAFRCYRSHDVIGVELGGALKNVIAIAAGATAGLGLGANAIAALMTRGLAEMARLGVALGADPLTFQGLAGMGDLAATCYSPLSRNRRLGELLASGMSVDQAIAEIGETVEGASTARVALALARRNGVDTPVMAEVAAVLEGESSIAEAMERLLSRALTTELEGQR